MTDSHILPTTVYKRQHVAKIQLQLQKCSVETPVTLFADSQAHANSEANCMDRTQATQVQTRIQDSFSSASANDQMRVLLLLALSS